MESNLVGLQNLADIISLVLQSSFISNEANGVSLVLVAKPETAKTTTIFKFNGLKHISYYDEITQKKLIEEFLPMVRHKQKRTLMIPDLINCVEKQRSTRDQFLNMIKSAIDDNGLIQISTAFKNLSPIDAKGLVEPYKFNLITAITSDSFAKIEKYLKETGISSRVLFFSYDYPLSLVNKIMSFKRGEKLPSSVIIQQPNETDQDIQGDSELFKSFEMIASKISSRYDGYGIRALENMIRLAKANAWINNRKKVNKSDIEKVMYLSNWINLDKNIIGE